MGDDQAKVPDIPQAAALPVVARSNARAGSPIDADYKVLWAPWRRLHSWWWALGPYLAYCAVLWGLAALLGWVF